VWVQKQRKQWLHWVVDSQPTVADIEKFCVTVGR
jgi:hypothetical protein